MEILLKNIGVIRNAEVKIDGLTILTGTNNSGKSTIGKALYSILIATENLEQMAFYDKRDYAIDYVRETIESFKSLRQLKYGHGYSNNEFFYKFRDSKIFSALIGDVSFSSLDSIILFIDELKKEILDFDVNNFIDEEEMKNRLSSRHGLMNNQDQDEEEEKKLAIANLEKLKEILVEDPELIEYSNARIIKSLNSEFFEQIQPVKCPDAYSNIKLKENDAILYDINIKGNDIKERSIPSFYKNPFTNVIFIDSSRVINSISSFARTEYEIGRRFYRVRDKKLKYSDITSNIRSYGHDGILLDKLLEKNTNLFEEMVNSNKCNAVLDIMNSILSENVYMHNSKMVYGKDKLDIRNLATGSKIFLLFKMLMNNGNIKENSCIILDEPESHLHPEWQNKFAEFIVLLIKELNIKIILTTHSPNFLLALETYSKKHKIDNNTHFYELIKSNSAYYSEVNELKDNISSAYATLSKPFLMMENIRMSIENED